MKEDKHLLAVVGRGEAPKLIVIGGMHGNEISGVEAMQKVLSELKSHEEKLKGTVYFVKGNLRALEKGERFVDIDLNRIWHENNLAKNQAYDYREFRELYHLIESICQGNYENCALLDLHTFSADSGIFCIPAENEKSEKLAKRFGAPFIEKLASALPETALNFYGKKGMLSLVFEGGRHGTAEATENLERAVWLIMFYLNMIDKKDFPFVDEMQAHILRISEQYPHHLEMIYRHKLEDYHNYKMYEGFRNFMKIYKNQPLALQNGEEVYSPAEGYMLMPLYQKKGSDGFFIVKEIKS